MIRPYLNNIINDHMDGWKIQLTMEINFISIMDSNEICTMPIHSQNLSILIGYEKVQIIKELF